jgi:hypothetical protein
MFDDIPIHNPERDKAWEAWIKRKDVKAFIKDRQDFKFPLDGSYEIWAKAWGLAWNAGFQEGYAFAQKEARDERANS